MSLGVKNKRKKIFRAPGFTLGESHQEGGVFELALLVLKDDEGIAERFESAFSEAVVLLENAPGYRSHCLTKCLEAARHYALVVEWESLSHHIEGFRESAVYPQWKALLGLYIQPGTWVRHFRPVVREEAREGGCFDGDYI
ncbi:MAG TPA: antibiotic biosynthesis monooxygenase [Eoetvoesiella sp.]|uniref:antibiotic biosynthesis monooxygenase family protein n=1 Tax=Eoetvoesiella sp. TaxID=1966355 RepID=UPI002B6561BF|nr:antibiotic biosynthesis monooxygenase [Eoetvoesiella sp.]HWK63227.1 antibiotic biosynthesis monooxygenase [Eoetvoesiella sp.]